MAEIEKDSMSLFLNETKGSTSHGSGRLVTMGSVTLTVGNPDDIFEEEDTPNYQAWCELDLIK
jgi:hypothetical protein